MSTATGKYSVKLFRPGGEGAGREQILDAHNDLSIARAIYRGRVEQYPDPAGSCSADRACVLARSDRPETMPR